MKIKNVLAKADIREVLEDASSLQDDDVTGAILILIRDDEHEFFTTEMSDADAVFALEVVKNRILIGEG